METSGTREKYTYLLGVLEELDKKYKDDKSKIKWQINELVRRHKYDY